MEWQGRCFASRSQNMPLHQYDYLFAFGIIFAFADAYGIGANDVANS
jgi:hypothetical protein